MVCQVRKLRLRILPSAQSEHFFSFFFFLNYDYDYYYLYLLFVISFFRDINIFFII